MAIRRLRAIAGRVVAIKPSERAISFFLFSYFFLITAPYYIIKPIRRSSYLDRQGDERLPLAYLMTAVIMGVIVMLHGRLQTRFPRRRLIVSSLLFFFFNILAFWLLFRFDWSWVPTVFWVWANIFAVVLVTQFWILVNDVFNPREARRLIGFIGSGGLLGSICGGLITGMLARTRMYDHLLLVAAGMLGLAMVAALGVFHRTREREVREEEAGRSENQTPSRERKLGFRDGFRTTRANRYLRLLAGIMLVTWVVSTLVDFQFLSIASIRVQDVQRLTSFFGYFDAGTMAFAFLLQLFFTSWIIRTLRIRLTLLVYPLVLLACSTGIGFAAYANLLPAILLKAGDKSLAYSLNQSVRELLYIPISPEQKYRSKIFIDMFLNRFAKGLGGVILWILLAVFGQGTPGAIRAISSATILVLLGWISLNVRAGEEYQNLVKARLNLKYERGDRLVAQKMDVDFARRVFDAIESRNRSPALYAMHLFDLSRQGKLTPEVRQLIESQADEVRAASIGTLLEQGETGLDAGLDAVFEEDNFEKDIQEIVSLDVYQEAMKAYLDRILDGPSRGDVVARMEAAKSIGWLEPRAPLADRLPDLLEDESPEVVRYALESAGRLGRREDVPLIIAALRFPVLREDASSALVQYGERIVGSLADGLGNREESPEVRAALCSILGRIGSQEAADVLTWELPTAEEPLRTEIIHDLDRIRSGHPDVRFDRDVIRTEIIRQVMSFCRQVVASSDAPEQGTGPAQRDRAAERSLSHVFKLLGLIYPHEDITRAFQNFEAGTKDSVAYAVELLDNLLEKEMREAVVPLIEDLSREERLERCRRLLADREDQPGGRRKDE